MRLLGTLALIAIAALPAQAAIQDDLVAAAASGDARQMVKLVHAGADVDTANSHGDTPLLAAIRRHDPLVVDLLLSHGASVTETDNRGVAPLLEAERDGTASILALLKPEVAFAEAYQRLSLAPGRYGLKGGVLERQRSGTLIYTRWGMTYDQALIAARVLGGPGVEYANPEQASGKLRFHALNTRAPQVTLAIAASPWRIEVQPAD
ncbi:MAG TPA: ankyrin repeat domain-containing protein [Oscillatoriaceae cyanobacterium]